MVITSQFNRTANLLSLPRLSFWVGQLLYSPQEMRLLAITPSVCGPTYKRPPGEEVSIRGAMLASFYSSRLSKQLKDEGSSTLAQHFCRCFFPRKEEPTNSIHFIIFTLLAPHSHGFIRLKENELVRHSALVGFLQIAFIIPTAGQV